MRTLGESRAPLGRRSRVSKPHAPRIYAAGARSALSAAHLPMPASCTRRDLAAARSGLPGHLPQRPRTAGATAHALPHRMSGKPCSSWIAFRELAPSSLQHWAMSSSAGATERIAYQLAVVVDDADAGGHRCGARRRPAAEHALADCPAAGAGSADAPLRATCRSSCEPDGAKLAKSRRSVPAGCVSRAAEHAHRSAEAAAPGSARGALGCEAGRASSPGRVSHWKRPIWNVSKSNGVRQARLNLDLSWRFVLRYAFAADPTP